MRALATSSLKAFILGLFCLMLTGCPEKSTTEDMGDALKNAGDAVEEAAEEAKDEAGDAVEEVKDAVDDATNQ